MPYGGSPSTSNTDAVRLYIYDTSTSSGSNIFQDAELTYFINANSNILYAAAAAADAAAGKFSGTGSASMKKVGDLQISYGGGNPASAYRQLAQNLRMQAAMGLKPYVGGITISDKNNEEADTDRVAPGVSIGMHDYETASSSTGRGLW